MSGITIICFIVAAMCLFVMYFTTGNRGSAQTTLTLIGFITILLIIAAGGVVTYINGWKWLLIYIVFIFVIGPIVHIIMRKVRGY